MSVETYTTSETSAARPGQGRRHAPFAVAPAAELLYSLEADGSRRWIDPVVTRGRYLRIRRVIAWVLIALFLALPHLRIGGKPALFVDLARRQLFLLGAVLHPTDNLLLLAFGAFVVIGVFTLTALFGRLWCGYGCPQPIYLEFLFRPVERLFRGHPNEKKRRAASESATRQALRQSATWIAFAVLAIVLAATFVAYFVEWRELARAPFEHAGALLTLVATAGLVFFDFAYFRDQMCTIACPYGRLQTLLYDDDTVIVGYDARRGEPRGHRRAHETGAPLGDCIDCNRCVVTCPTGMDIRRGLQMECIGCAQCIEACDEVMAKLHRPRGLIRYTSLRELAGGTRRFLRPRVFAYVGLTSLALAALVILSGLRPEATAEILRNGREAYRLLPTGEVANLLRVRLTNHRPGAQAFTIELTEPRGAALVVTESPFRVEGGEVATVEVVARLPESAFANGRATGRFVIRSDAGASLHKEFVLLGPFRGKVL